MIAILVALTMVNATGWLLPAPTDKLGWGLRVLTLDFHRPYLVRESLDRGSFEVVLINQSKEVREYVLLEIAQLSRALRVIILKPDGNPLRSHGRGFRSDLLTGPSRLPAGQLVVSRFGFDQFEYDELPVPGEYQMRATLKTTEGIIVSPALKLTVIEPAPDAILASHQVPLEGYQANWPKAKQERAVIQQIKVGNRVWLFYRKFLSSELGGKVIASFRLAELPGKVELQAEGAFGDGGPLTIKFKDPKSKTGSTSLVINSNDGMPWTEDEEQLRLERIAPAPRPVKP